MLFDHVEALTMMPAVARPRYGPSMINLSRI